MRIRTNFNRLLTSLLVLNSVGSAPACNEWIAKFFEYYAAYSDDDSKTIRDVCEATKAYGQEKIEWYHYTSTVTGELVTLEYYVLAGEKTFP